MSFLYIQYYDHHVGRWMRDEGKGLLDRQPPGTRSRLGTQAPRRPVCLIRPDRPLHPPAQIHSNSRRDRLERRHPTQWLASSNTHLIQAGCLETREHDKSEIERCAKKNKAKKVTIF